jgi:hypothetical protein
MNPDYSPAALIGPYTLMEEEALSWAILLFQKAVLLHPFPLPLPESYNLLIGKGWLQVRIPAATPEEIKLKDKRIRAIEAFIDGMPEQSFLKYLHEVSLQEDWETQEEILGQMRGEPGGRFPKKNEPISGQLLLCLIHSWITQQWVLEAALNKIAEQEQNLARSWQESLEEEDQGSQEGPRRIKKEEFEIPCSLALTAWEQLKKQLISDPGLLFTSQSWVWKNLFGTDWDESPTLSLPLPELPFSGVESFSEWMEGARSGPLIPTIRGVWKRLLNPSSSRDSKEVQREWEKTLSTLGLTGQGRYQLILPLFQSEPGSSPGMRDQHQVLSLILITPI